MWIYLGFLAVLLTLYEKNIRRDIVLARDNIYKGEDPWYMKKEAKYKDSNNNEIHFLDLYCLHKNCVLKCCNDGADLNENGSCPEDDLTTEFVYHDIYVYKWSDKQIESKAIIHTEIDKDLKNDEKIADFYILEGGFLKIKLKNDTEKWLVAAPLDFCVNIHVAAVVELDRNYIEFIHKYYDLTDHKFAYIAAVMVGLLLLIGFIVFSVRRLKRWKFGLDILALIFTLTAAYITITVQLLASKAGIISTTECRIISPFVYFFVLSIFFWLIAMSFNSIWMITKRSIHINQEVDFAKFKRFCIFGWLLPFLMTAYAIIVDTLKLAVRWRPPFDSCLTEAEVDRSLSDVGTRVFMYIPIAILTAIIGTLYVMYLYNILKLQRDNVANDNIQDISKFMISKHSYAVQIKLLVIIAVSGVLVLIPNVPRVISYTIHAYNVLVGSTMFAMFVYERFKYDVPITCYNFSEKFSKISRKDTATDTEDRNSIVFEGRS